jgi:hypothetical protein
VAAALVVDALEADVPDGPVLPGRDDADAGARGGAVEEDVLERLPVVELVPFVIATGTYTTSYSAADAGTPAPATAAAVTPATFR